MFKENRKSVDSWTFDWINQRTGQQRIRMKLYECSGLLAKSKYVIEFENKYGLVFNSECYASISDGLLMGYFFEMHLASIMDKYILGEDEGFSFDQIKKTDFEVMNSLYWDEFDEAYPNQLELKYPNGNGWNFNPRTKDYFALFHGVYDCEKRQHDIIKALGITAWGQDGTHSINLKISNKSAFLESENGKRIYEFENPDHILFLAEHSYCLKQRMSVNGYSLLQSYYGK
ncbi:MAG TPA: hypothetical protein H9814_08785 [Candidatus Bacteroides merdigallinarum]|uniref:Uncharacterized protein n=1 Tax=Candidatus Bacteroides merdigallinarum TaxID=2838473 RepID=A0A9D2EA27_9BACE|nr:hypothetical protein [Candidatus Bacteroides merdigallinarum]